MGVLTGKEILRQRELGNIVIEPFDEKQLNPNSYDLRLADKLLVYAGAMRQWTSNSQTRGPTSGSVPVFEKTFSTDKEYQPYSLDMSKENETFEIEIPVTGIVLYPGMLFLGGTVEKLGSDKFASALEGKSSLGRLGLVCHSTAGFIDCGFHGNVTTEMSVIHPLRVYAGMRVGQICFFEMTGEISLYKGRYQGQKGAEASRIWQDFLPK